MCSLHSLLVKLCMSTPASGYRASQSLKIQAVQHLQQKNLNRKILDTIVSMIPTDRGSVSVGFLFRLLSISIHLGASSVTKTELIRRASLQFEATMSEIEHELGNMRSERVKMNERNKKLENHVDVEEYCCTNSKQALEMLRSTAAIVGKDSAEEMMANERKLEKEIQPYAEELDAIRKAFKIKNEMVFDMKKQLVSLQKSVDEAHKGKSLWTGISSATTILAAALTAYIARGR